MLLITMGISLGLNIRTGSLEAHPRAEPASLYTVEVYRELTGVTPHGAPQGSPLFPHIMLGLY